MKKTLMFLTTILTVGLVGCGAPTTPGRVMTEEAWVESAKVVLSQKHNVSRVDATDGTIEFYLVAPDGFGDGVRQAMATTIKRDKEKYKEWYKKNRTRLMDDSAALTKSATTVGVQKTIYVHIVDDRDSTGLIMTLRGSSVVFDILEKY